jgi:hypothetical protein
MKNLKTRSLAGALTIAFVVGCSGQVLAATTVSLGTSGNFAILANSAITDIPTSVIKGDVGLSPAAGSFYTGLTTGQVAGTIYAVDSTGPAGSVNNPALLTAAQNDLTTAYIDAAGRTPTNTFVAGDNQLGGKTLTPGVYAFGAASSAAITAASPLTLDAQGDPNAIFIFQASSTLVTASGSVVKLINGAQACNVYWQVGSSATLGTNSTFVGTIMALTSATLTTGVNVSGRVLARNGAVTIDAATISRPACTTTTISSGGGGGSSSSGGNNGSSSTGGGSTPTLPNTGFAPKQKSVSWNILAPVGAVLAVGAYYMTRKKWTTRSR